MPDDTPTGDNASVTTADAQDGSITDTLGIFTETVTDALADGNSVDSDAVETVGQTGEQLTTEVSRLESQLADTTDVEIPKECRVVCSDCGADGGTYSFTVPQGEPAYCPWCGHAVDSEVTDVSSAETEPTAVSWEADP